MKHAAAVFLIAESGAESDGALSIDSDDRVCGYGAP
jgi:hypothetical protein